MRDRYRVLRSSALICALYGLLALVSTHRLWRHLTTAVPSDIGDPLLNTWILAWDGHALLTDPAHLFDANIFFPLKDTLAYSEHLLGTALPMLPILLISGEPVLAYNVAFLTSFMLSGFSLYLLALRYTGNRLAAFLAGLAFAFAPYHLSLIGHLSLLTVQWLPLTLLYLDAFLQPALTPPLSQPFGFAQDKRRERRGAGGGVRVGSLALFAFFFICQATTSWHLAVFTSFIVALYVLGNWLTRRAAFSWLTLAGLGAAALVVALVMAPLILPYLKVLPELHKTRPWDTIVTFAATPTDYLAAYPANLLFGPLTAPFRTRPGFIEEHTLFPGLLASMLTAFSLKLFAQRGTGRTRSVMGILWVILVLSVSLTFGPFLRLERWGVAIPMPYHLLAGLTSALSLMRVPPRWMVVGLFAMSLLLGFSLTSIFAWARRKGWSTPSPRPSPRLGGGRQMVYGLALLLGLGLLAEGYAAPIPLAHVGSTAQLPEVYRWLPRDGDDYAILEMPFYSAPQPEYPETRRLYASTIHWKQLVNGYSGLTPSRQPELAQRLAGFPDQGAIAALQELGAQGVRYLIVHSLEQGFDRDSWEVDRRWRLARSLTLRPVYESGGDFVYEVNPYGQAVVTAPETVTDSFWRERLPRPVEADFAGLVSLLAYEVLEGDDGSLSLVLYWRCLERMENDYTVFVHLLDAEGNIVAQGDSPPVQGHYPTTMWAVAEMVRDEHPLVGPPEAVARGVRFAVGWYSQEGRLEVVKDLEATDYVDLLR
ncbi:MAG: hypothetical protein ACETWR_13295 [Anaerolineae bacterium]